MTPLYFSPGAQGLLAPLEPFMQDNTVAEILINQPQQAFIERCGRMEWVSLPIMTSLHLKRLFTCIANENQQILNTMHPLLSGSLYDGTRVQLVMPPVAKHLTLAIRRPSINAKTLTDFNATGYYDAVQPFSLTNSNSQFAYEEDKALFLLYQQARWHAFLELAVVAKKNIVIAGETSSGKTTFLNACGAHIPIHERLITLEDTFEVQLPHSNQVNLIAPKGLSNAIQLVTMQDLIQCALRLRPDRLIMGEIRGKEVLDFVSACATGHAGSITTIHANTPKMALMRMVQLYKLNNVPSMRDSDILQELHAVIDIIVQLRRNDAGRQMTAVYYKGAA